MVRQLGRIIILFLNILQIFSLPAWAELNEDIISEIISKKSQEEETILEQNIHELSNNNFDKNFNKTTIKKKLPLTRQDKSNISYNKGLDALNNNQEIEATSCFKKSLQEYPQNHKARIQLVKLYKKIGWTDEIEKLLQQGLDLDPEHADFIKNLAEIYQQKGQTRKALAVLLSMPDLHANEADYLALLALVYLNSDQPEMSIKYYQRLLNINKNNPTWWLGLAISQNTIGDKKSALDSFNQAKLLGRFNAEILDYIDNQIDLITRS